MRETNILYYGRPEPLPEQIHLRAGPLALVFENGDLRTIRLGNQEIIRRLYVAVRDRNWGTVAPVYANLRMERAEDHFCIAFDVENRQGEIHFTWRGVITGAADGTITYTMEGQARADFCKNRIGFCVLHPAKLGGSWCEIEHVDGSKEAARLPAVISPDQPVPPFGDLRAIAHEVTPGVRAEVRMEGDTFEMEDQRNWTDASYKTFSTPLRIPYPARIRAGDLVKQSVTIRLIGFAHSHAGEVGESRVGQAEEPVVVYMNTEGRDEVALPEIGLGLPRGIKPLSEKAIERLRRLNLSHLRVDIAMEEPDFKIRLGQAVEQARKLRTRLFVGLIFDPYAMDAKSWLEEVRAAVQEETSPVAMWLVYPSQEQFAGGTPVREAVDMARAALDGAVDGARFAAGTNNDLIFLQRSPPPLDRIFAVCFSVNPQVHAFDNQSVVETLHGQMSAIHTAGILAYTRPVIVSPVTLKPRQNPYATGPDPIVSEGALPPDVDPRQASLFGAVWTVGSISSLALGARSVTYYETTGWRGVLLDEDDTQHKMFPANPGEVFPLYHILATVGQMNGGALVPAYSSNSLKVGVLCMRWGFGNRFCLLLANYTAEPQEVIVRGVPDGEAQVRWLDETNARFAMEDPEGYRASDGELVRITGGETRARLLPYGVRRLFFLGSG